IQVLVKMKQPIILPKDDAERVGIRKHPPKALDAPTPAKQKSGIITHGLVYLLVFAVFILGIFSDSIGWQQYLLLLVICIVPGLYNLLNLFAVIEDGILSGSKFIPWKKIKSYRFVSIDVNHRFYGHVRKVNNKYELKIKMTLFSTSVVVISREMKHKLHHVFNEHEIYDNSNSGKGEP